MNTNERLTQISTVLEATKTGWPFLLEILNEQVRVLTEQLVNQDNEQTRGRIKQLLWVMELPETLTQEREGIRAGLSEQDPAD